MTLVPRRRSTSLYAIRSYDRCGEFGPTYYCSSENGARLLADWLADRYAHQEAIARVEHDDHEEPIYVGSPTRKDNP